MSKQKENLLAKKINNNTNLTAIRAGYSGNCAYPMPDIFIVEKNTAIELKCTTTDKIAVNKKTDIQQLLKFCDSLSTQSIPLIALDYPHRELEVFNPRIMDTDLMSSTTEKYIYLEKPSLDNHASAKSGREDHTVIEDYIYGEN